MNRKVKKLFKSPWFYLAVIICVVILTLYIFGFRITYNPELDNNWDGVSACAAWVAVFVAGVGSVISIYFAIQVPKKIAEEQNRIALFEKRYEIFQFYERCFDFRKRLIKHDEIGDLRKDCMLFFDENSYSELREDIVENKIFEIEYTLHQMFFLFPNISDDLASELYEKLYKVILRILDGDADSQNVKQVKKDYIETMGEFIDSYHKMIFNELSIYKCK